jgi:GT2 family glycosyltransferase
VQESAIQLSVVIVSWNVQEHLCRCLDSLKTGLEQESRYETIVVDNNSADDTVAMLERDFPEVKLIRNQDNVGFARANNQGINLSRGQFILLLNPDTEVKKGSIGALTSFLRSHDRAGIAGPQLLNPDGIPQGSGANLPSLVGSLLGYFRVKKEVTGAYHIHADHPVAVKALVGACLLVRREVIEQVGGFDEDYFMYVEEVDWCYRIGQAGWQIYYVPSATIYHYGGQSTALVPAKMYLALRKSRILFALKHRSRLEALLLSLGYGISSALKGRIGNKDRQPIFRQATAQFFSTAWALLVGRTKL